MKFAIATVAFWESLGYDTANWRKSNDGNQAITELKYAEILGVNLAENPEVKIYFGDSPELIRLLESTEWHRDGTNGPFDSYNLLEQLAEVDTRLTTAMANVTELVVDAEETLTEFDVALEAGVVATNIENKLNNLETTYAPRLLSAEQQLADTLNKSAITLTHMFADNTVRDAYFVANPTELIDLQFIKVGTAYQQYIEGAWTDSVPIVSEQLSATNQPIVDTGNYFTTDNTNAALQELGAHKASSANPHGVTKAQVGLGNVDNTSDVNKPVSTATQTALNAKANKAKEAWITPTLINGAIQDPIHPVQYYKDQFGRVYFRGRASNVPNDQPLFGVPTGYRPPVADSNTSIITPKSIPSSLAFARITINGGWGHGVVYVSTSAPDIVYFDGFNYSVEA